MVDVRASHHQETFYGVSEGCSGCCRSSSLIYVVLALPCDCWTDGSGPFLLLGGLLTAAVPTPADYRYSEHRMGHHRAGRDRVGQPLVLGAITKVCVDYLPIWRRQVLPSARPGCSLNADRASSMGHYSKTTSRRCSEPKPCLRSSSSLRWPWHWRPGRFADDVDVVERQRQIH